MTMIAVDLSGSFPTKDLDAVVGVVQRIARSGATLAFFDTHVFHTATVTPDTVKQEFETAMKRAFGGTDVRPAFDLAEQERASELYVITDGYFQVPAKPGFRVTWVGFNREIEWFQPGYGRVVAAEDLV